VGNSYPLLFNNPPAVQNMTLCLSYSLIQIGHRKPPQSLPLNSSTTKPSSRVRPGCAEQGRRLPIKTQICVLIFRPAVAALRGAAVAARSPPAVTASTRTALWKKAQPPMCWRNSGQVSRGVIKQIVGERSQAHPVEIERLLAGGAVAAHGRGRPRVRRQPHGSLGRAPCGVRQMFARNYERDLETFSSVVEEQWKRAA
jgi:hypothetical protein